MIKSFSYQHCKSLSKVFSSNVSLVRIAKVFKSFSHQHCNDQQVPLLPLVLDMLKTPAVWSDSSSPPSPSSTPSLLPSPSPSSSSSSSSLSLSLSLHALSYYHHHHRHMRQYFIVVSSDRSSCTDDGLLYIRAAATFSDLEHSCLSILLQVSL